MNRRNHVTKENRTTEMGRRDKRVGAAIDAGIFGFSGAVLSRKAPETGRIWGQRWKFSVTHDCLAVVAVCCEPLSGQNSLLTGKITGNFAESALLARF